MLLLLLPNFCDYLNSYSYRLSFNLQELYDIIAVELSKFISAHPENNDETAANDKKLGFTLSYAANQASATSGAAIKWKNFSADDIVKVYLILFCLVTWLT